MKCKSIILCVIFMIVPVMSFADNSLHQVQRDDSAPQAEDVVTFKEESVACDSIENYRAYNLHIQNKETDLAKTMVDNYTCALIPPTEQFIVLSVKYVALSQYVRFKFTTNNTSEAWAGAASIDKIQHAEH